MLCCLELFCNLAPCGAVEILALALAINDAKIDRCAPAAVRPLVDRTFAVSTSLCHGLPPYSSFVVHTFLCSTVFRLLSHADTGAVCCEVLREGVKWRVIWLVPAITLPAEPRLQINVTPLSLTATIH